MVKVQVHSAHHALVHVPKKQDPLWSFLYLNKIHVNILAFQLRPCEPRGLLRKCLIATPWENAPSTFIEKINLIECEREQNV